MTLDEIIKRLQDAPNRMDIARATDMDYMYLSRLAWGKMKRPGAAQIDRLRNHFLAEDVRNGQPR